MIRYFDTSKIVTHERYRALGEAAQSVYLELLARANPSGHVTPANALVAFDRLSSGTLATMTELIESDLLVTEPDGSGYWIVLPETLDGAALFAAGQVP